MTFGEFILLLRERLNDMRKSDATLITTASDDGIRWTSAKLLIACNSALGELSRLVATYSKSPALIQLAGSEFLVALSDGADTTGGDGTVEVDATVLSILQMYTETTPKENVAYVTPRFFLNYIAEDRKPRTEDKFFTIMYDTSDSKRKIFTLNVGGGKDIMFTYVYRKTSYAAGVGGAGYAEEIYLTGLDDLLLDIAERECRDREHNWERSKILDVRIMSKIGINVGG